MGAMGFCFVLDGKMKLFFGRGGEEFLYVDAISSSEAVEANDNNCR